MVTNHSEIFKIQDASSYDDVSTQFDVFTQTVSLPFAERMIRLAQLRPGDRILDIGTGTGIVALNAASSVPNGHVLAVDLSEGMLATARQKAVWSGSRVNITFCRMDAEALKIANGSFDIVLSLYALMHFPNPSVALGEMFRVLQPGGALVVAVGGGPSLFSLAAVPEVFRRMKEVMLQRAHRLLIAPAFLDSLVEKHLPGPKHEELSSLAQAGLHRPKDVLSLVREAGFTGIQTSWNGRQARINTAEDFWSIQSTFSSLARKRLAAAPPDKLSAVRAEFFETCRQVQASGGQFVYPTGALFVKARKPA
jgi:ubiquinone/menaquinone biosynthesis C-methylase UbiE